MSMKTWKAKYYPVVASKVSKKNALQHSLQKWLGLLPSVLKKHGLWAADSCIGNVIEIRGDNVHLGDEGDLEINWSTCALCHHFAYKSDADNDCCAGCPLNEVLGEPCDSSDDNGDSPYWTFVCHNDPKPMIAGLKKAVAKQKKKEGK